MLSALEMVALCWGDNKPVPFTILLMVIEFKFYKITN